MCSMVPKCALMPSGLYARRSPCLFKPRLFLQRLTLFLHVPSRSGIISGFAVRRFHLAILKSITMPQIKCPSCEKSYRVKDELAGKRVKCPCGNQIVVPGVPVSASVPTVASTETSAPMAQANAGISNPDIWGVTAPAAQINPYAPIASSASFGQAGDGNSESIRKAHLSHEASIKSIGVLYLLGAIIGFLLTILYVVGGISSLLFPQKPESVAIGVMLIVLAIVVGAISTIQFILARGLSRLTPWSRIGGIVLSCLGLLAIPIGTLISAYFLYLLGSQKGIYIFSPEYAQVIAATPHIKYKTSIIVWILLGILLTVIALGILAAVVGTVMG